MIFIIWVSLVVGLLVLGTLLSIRWGKNSWRRWNGSVLSVFGLIAFAVFFVGGFTMLIGGVGPSKARVDGHSVLQSTHELRALVTKDSDSASGEVSFFLGIGGGSYTQGTATTIAYIERAKDGGSTLESASIDSSIIYEGSEKPYVEDWLKVWTDNGLWFPWPVTLTDSSEPLHKFHIPAGTILEQYSVNP